jgi:hypothetical protein
MIHNKQAADIGVAMGKSGTDVAKEVSTLIYAVQITHTYIHTSRSTCYIYAYVYRQWRVFEVDTLVHGGLAELCIPDNEDDLWKHIRH